MIGILIETARAYEEVAVVLEKGGRLVAHETAKNLVANVDTAFQAAETFARCRDLRDVAGAQAAVANRMFAQISDQTQQLHELCGYLATDVAQAAKVAASRSFLALDVD